jgi:8-oxo-dGTP diphosphatase
MRVFVFRADDCEGVPIETAEAIPLWTPIESLPFDEMWADDRLWLPAVLAGETVDGSFVFDGDRMLDHTLTITGSRVTS